MKIPRRSLPALPIVLFACILAGCGGSSSSSATTSSAPTKAEYVAKANAICAAASTQTGKLLGEVESATTAALRSPGASGGARLADLVARLHTAALRVLGDLRSLTPPAGESAAVAQFLTPLTQAITGLGQADRAIVSGHATQALSGLLELQSKTPALASAAKANGLTQCEGVLSGTPGSAGASG